jgi:transposase
MRTMLGNQVHFLAMSQSLCRKQKLFTKKGRAELERLVLGPWLDQAKRREDAVRLMTHPGIGPVNALAFDRTDNITEGGPFGSAN